MIEKKHIEINGTRIVYLEGKPDRGNGWHNVATGETAQHKDSGRISPVIILIHGLFAGGVSWEEIMPGLSKKYHVFAPDLPGQGESDIWNSETVTFSKYASFIKDFCDKLEISNAILVGHSMGGGIAIVTAATYARLFFKAVFIDSVCYKFKQPLKGRIVQTPILGEFIFKKIYGWGMFRSYFKNDVTFNAEKINEKRLKLYYSYFNSSQRRDFAYQLLKMISNPQEVEAKIGSINIPVLIIWGSNDTLIPVSCGYRLVREIKGAKIEVIQNCGHAPQEEEPAKTLEVMYNFL